MASSHTREALLAPISECFAGKGIPAVLWGNFLLTVHGVPSIVSEADFVIHDSLLPAAIAVLMESQELKLTPCLDPETCFISKADRPSPVPAFHAHRPDSNVHVALHVQSATLGAVVAPLTLNQGADLLSLDLIPASHPSLPPPDELGFGHGSLLPKEDGSPSPVWVLPSHTYLEAIVRLIREDDNIYVTYFMATVIYFMEYVDPKGHLEEDKLSPACLKFWKDINDEDTRSSDAIKRLREGLAGQKKALITRYPTLFEQRAAVFFYKSPQGKLIQIDFPVQDTAPYIPAQAMPIKDLRPGVISMITMPELIVFKIEVCGRRLEAPKKRKDADDAYNLLMEATKDGNLRLSAQDKQIIEVCLPYVIKFSSSGQTEKWWRQKLGLPISRTPSPTRPRGLSPA